MFLLDGGEVDGIAAAISSARDAFAEDERKLNAVTQYPHFLLPKVYDLTRHRRVIGPVLEILGEDLLVWGASLFIKPPHKKQDRVLASGPDLLGPRQFGGDDLLGGPVAGH